MFSPKQPILTVLLRVGADKMSKIIKIIFKYILLFQIGGCLYYYIEVLSRGWSHWSMYVLAGLCFCFVSVQNKIPWWDQKLYKQLIRCTIFVVSGEFITGCMVNLWLKWEVWDYSQRPLNLRGQICLPMAMFFGALCFVGIWLDKQIRHYAFDEIR